MRLDWRRVVMSGFTGSVLGLAILGAGGRGVMRVIANWEGRVPVLTLNGTLTVLFVATLAGTCGGIIYGTLKQVVANALVRNGGFLVFCVAFTLYAVKDILLRPKMLFVALILAYAIVLELTQPFPIRSPLVRSKK